MAVTSKTLLVKVTAADGSGDSYLINPLKIIMVCPATVKKEDGTIERVIGTHVFLEGDNGRHVLESMEFFEALKVK